MNWRLAGFLIAAGIVLGRVAVRWIKTDKPILAVPVPQTWSWWKLVLASFLTLFAELALIRWIGTEVRIFAYVKNLALLLCFLGFGLGCALARYPVRWWSSVVALLGLVMAVRAPWHAGQAFESLSQALGGAQDIQIWATGAVRHWPDFLAAAAIAGVLLLLITYAFIPLGQTVSAQFELAARPLQGYSWNLAASLAGILAFFAVCWFSLPPGVWVAGIFLGFGLLQDQARRGILIACVAIPAALLLHDVSTPLHYSFWTPYQQIEVSRLNFSDGEFGEAIVDVNHTGYQFMVNLSNAFLQRHPGLLQEPVDENPYNMPFAFAPAAPRVLIVGAGSGNDAAAAIRNQSRSVDAVEIDPGILALGKTHPEHPYSAPQASVHLTDARAYMKRASGPYDLVLFGLLDSHTELSDYSNMRIDNFVYTKESLQEAKALLAPHGVLFIKFQVDRPFIGRRLIEMLTAVFGKSPVVFWAGSSYTAGGACFAISSSTQVEERLATDPRLREFVTQHRPDFLESSPVVPMTTDDWPYLYQEGRWMPGIFVSVGILVLMLGAGLYWQIPEARKQVPSLFFFAMGAGFLLLETQVISRLALYFGTTWQVNGIVIAAILAALLVANAVIERQAKPWPSPWYLAALLAGIAVAYLVPFSRIPGPAALVGCVAACIFTVPVFFAGLLFATEFRTADSPSAALGANMLGAVVGGLLENLSLIIGLKALLLIALGLYALAGVGLLYQSKRPVRRPASVLQTAGR
jgi:spermidine synthase